ncbi:hypothetical protein B0H19DRAFT_1137328, partial [Mycena capillaripes]
MAPCHEAHCSHSDPSYARYHRQYLPDFPGDATRHHPAAQVGTSLVQIQLEVGRRYQPILSSLIGGRTDEQPLQLYSHVHSLHPADLHAVLATHGPHLRSLVVEGTLTDPHVLRLCTHLERFEWATLPTDALVDAIPRSIKALAVTNATRDPAVPQPMITRVYVPPGPVSHIPVAHLTQQLDTFPHLRIFTWVGSIAHLGFGALQKRCKSNFALDLSSP